MVPRLLVTLSLLLLPFVALAESSSSNFILWANGVMGGGNVSTSENYINFGSVSDFAGDPGSSPDYYGVFGFEALTEDPRIIFSIATTDLDLSPDPLTVSAVSTAATSVTVSINADFGYSLTVTATTPLQTAVGDILDPVADGAVTAGSEEFGLAVSGEDAAFGDDRGLSATPLLIASNSLWGAERVTALTFKAAVSVLTEAGTYSGVYTIIATGNF